MSQKRFTQVCYCDKCGNEAEMTITCELKPEEERELEQRENVQISKEKREGKPKGEAVCSYCGSEADIWLDM